MVINIDNMGSYFYVIGLLLVLVLFIYIIYLIKRNSLDDEDTFDLKAVSKQIEEEYKGENITLTDYEKEQEENAIISYDDLIKNKDKMAVGYDDEYKTEEIPIDVKKFDLDNTNTPKLKEEKLNVNLMNYSKEEEFLKALKGLQSKL